MAKEEIGTKRRGRGRPRIIHFDQIPDFFKVYVPEHCSQQLHIPPDFIKQFNIEAPKKVTLENLDGQIWHLDMEKNEDGMFLKNGWSKFVTDNSLKLGEFLVFRYKGNSNFTVRIFGTNECKKDEGSLDEDSFTNVKVEANLGDCERRPKRSRGDQEEGDLEEVTNFMSKSKYPSVKLVNEARSYMDMPVKFANMHIKEGTRIVKLEVSNKQWSVSLARGQRSRLYGGWGVFATENSLQNGDICVLELIDKDHHVFKVTIFRHTK